MSKALTKTDFHFPGQKSVYHGKVRDVYNINDEKLIMVATDRISAFDVVLPEGIPYKGQMLNQIAAKFLDATSDICPNWKLATPDPMVTVGVMCQGFPVEMIVRGYLCGSAWRAYKSGVCVRFAVYACPKTCVKTRNSRIRLLLLPQRLKWACTTRISRKKKSLPADLLRQRNMKHWNVIPSPSSNAAHKSRLNVA